MKRLGFAVDQLWMIESLDPQERQTGTALYKDVWIPRTATKKKLDCEYRNCPTKADVIAALEEVALSAENTGYPMLHIECHGHDEKKGLILADNSLFTWKELAPYFQDINVNCCVNLCVVLAACFGKEGIWIFGDAGFKRAPMYALIGSIDELWASELEQVFKLFYREFIETFDLAHSLTEANTEVRSPGNRIQIADVEHLYQVAAERSVYKGKERQAHKEAIVSEIMKNPIISEKGIGYARQLYKEHNDHEHYQQKVKEKYFCFDLCSDNRERFD